MENKRITKIQELIKSELTTYDRLAMALTLLNKIKLSGDSVATINKYVVKINPVEGSWSCSCPDYLYKKKMCKHVLALLLKAKAKTFNMFLESALKRKNGSDIEIIKTKIPALDGLIGGIPLGRIVGIFGPTKVGKTWLSAQLASVISISTKRPVLYLDTEGFFFPTAQKLILKIMEKRFKVEPELEFIELRSLQQLGEFFGIGYEVSMTEKKTDIHVRFTASLVESAAFKLLTALGVSGLVLDSFTAPVKRILGSATQNLPARAAVINSLLARLEEIASRLNIPVLLVHHASRSPLNPYDPYKPYGGPTLLYNLKYLLLLQPGGKPISNPPAEPKRVIRYVWPFKLRDEITLYLVKNYGYVDEVTLHGASSRR